MANPPGTWLLDWMSVFRSLSPLHRTHQAGDGPGSVLLKHGSTGLYLATGGEWIADARKAHRFNDHDRARRSVDQHACELKAFELVGAGAPQ